MWLGPPGILYHPQSVSMMHPRWKSYYQVSPRKTFSLVNQAAPTGVLRQGVGKMSL